MQAGTGIAELVAQETAKQVIKILISCNISSICNHCLENLFGEFETRLDSNTFIVQRLTSIVGSFYLMSGENIIGGRAQENMAVGHTCKRPYKLAPNLIS